MTGSDTLLDDQELEFLLQHSDGRGPGDVPDEFAQFQSAKVTIRGELDKIDLADIFQTLSLSKMEGILRVENAVECREIYFHEGAVRYSFPSRAETRRLGQRLIRCALLSPDQLRSALVSQKREPQPLGRILIEMGAITQDDLDTLLTHQLEEDLYDLFTWQQGQFEFYKGQLEDAFLIDRFNRAPAFDVSVVLLEVARRSDEWSQILGLIRSVEHVPIIRPDIELPEMSGDELTVCETIDDFATIREVAEAALLSLFDCAKAVCELYRKECIRLATPAEMVERAKTSLDGGNPKRGLLLCHTLLCHPEPIDPDVLHALSDVVQHCGDNRLAGRIVLGLTMLVTDPAGRLSLARRARQIDRNSIAILRFQYSEYVDQDKKHDDDFADVVHQFTEALSDAGEHDDALMVFRDLELLRPDEATTLSRKARLLQRAGRTEDALEVLMELKEDAEAVGDRNRLLKLCEQILKISPRHKEVTRALQELKLGRTKALLLRMRMAAAGVAVLCVAWFLWSHFATKARLEAAASSVLARLTAEDVPGAEAELAANADVLSGTEMEFELSSQLEALKRSLVAAERQAKEQEILDRLRRAGELARSGGLAEALATYKTLLDDKQTAAVVLRSAPSDLHGLGKQLAVLNARFKDDLPPAPRLVQPLEELEQGLADLEARLAVDATLAVQFLAAATDPTLHSLMGEATVEQNKRLAQQIVAGREVVAARRTDYEKHREEKLEHRKLEPVMLAAIEAETNHDFQTAEDLYRQLYDSLRDNATHEPGLRARVAKYSAINQSLALLRAAADKVDLDSARAQYQHLQRIHREIPWSRIVELPLRVVTTPPGATVLFNGREAGRSPITLLFKPAVENQVHIRLEGFMTEQTSVSGDARGLLRTILTRAPEWQMPMGGTIERAPATRDELAVFADRSGNVSAWSLTTRRMLWNRQTKDLSGLLTAPQIWRDQVLVGSIDGLLRSYYLADGKLAWQLDRLSTEATPVVIDDRIVVASERRLVFVSLDRREIDWETELSSVIRQDLTSWNGHVIAVSDDGSVRAVHAQKKRDAWPPLKLPRGLPGPVLVHGSTAVFQTDEGSVTAYDLRSAKQRWQRSGYGDLRLAPARAGDTLILAAPPTLKRDASIVVLRISDGTVVAAAAASPGEMWCAPPVVVGELLLVSNRDGIVHVLDPRSLGIRYRLRGQQAATAPPVLTKAGLVLGAFGNQVLVFGPLP